MSDDYRRYHLAHDEAYKDLWELKQAAYREGYLHAMEVRQYRDYGLEG